MGLLFVVVGLGLVFVGLCLLSLDELGLVRCFMFLELVLSVGFGVVSGLKVFLFDLMFLFVCLTLFVWLIGFVCLIVLFGLGGRIVILVVVC